VFKSSHAIASRVGNLPSTRAGLVALALGAFSLIVALGAAAGFAAFILSGSEERAQMRVATQRAEAALSVSERFWWADESEYTTSSIPSRTRDGRPFVAVVIESGDASCTVRIARYEPLKDAGWSVVDKLAQDAEIGKIQARRLIDVALISRCVHHLRQLRPELAGAAEVTPAKVERPASVGASLEAARAMLIADELDEEQFERVTETLDQIEAKWDRAMRATLRQRVVTEGDG
jgi:hypothetical protein